jgi:hypothetical protein
MLRENQFACNRKEGKDDFVTIGVYFKAGWIE